MSLLPHQLELLSPARDADIGIEAVNHGADAVYIGGPAFGARATAGNDIRDLQRLINHAHRFGSRIFITLNTILRDDELEAARKMAWQIYEAGADALIIQDMGLLELDLPPIQLHASTQTDIRTPEKARFLQDAGLSQIVVARELDLQQIAAVRAATDPARTTIEFFVHGALCVAYSGQCYITHAHTGRSANRGDCNQACRLPYEVLDASGRIIAHEKHVLSMKDNNQSDNLRALIDAGVRSFKIEGRYKDMGYVKNITAHYRKLLDEIIEEREFSDTPLARSSSGSTTFSFTPDPDQNFNREFTDYFVNGRKEDIGAFDTPKTPGRAIGWVTKVGENFVEIETSSRDTELHNGDGLCYYDLQKELVGLQINRAESVDAKKSLWRLFPKDPIAGFKDLRKGLEVNRNRDMAWVRTLDKKSSDRRIGLWAELKETPDGFALTLTDEDGFTATAAIAQEHQAATDAARAEATLREQLGRFGATIFSVHDIGLQLSQPWFVPASALNQLRRDAVAALEAARQAGFVRLPRALPVEPPVPFPEDTLTYLANVYNQKAHDFYIKHGVKVMDAAYESKEEEGEVSLMITKHCVRFSMSLCPKQAKGVIGVKGTIKAEPLQLINGKEKLTLRFDCKPCEMHVVGKMKRAVINQHAKEMQEFPMQFYRTRPVPSASA
ncbi:peptidase U32 [Delftia acidovorans SPH-1]|jgi:putative protease|uniref:Peptidase U32 n=1 Tax=Delftia acidovorans (strain DSM 14801 / SPH-1) TaxID=398578 RepID=A9BM95_DELAS|nr:MULTISPECIES: U32 family peptidase [Delftia]MCP4018988.1 U32 family peptidase [Delftia sp.]OLE93223.1 MAG: protease [Delftia sp. 13_1_40CM_3_66_6]ABX37440.1 peptidase U32 [Delftia acidovorans SPH-1]MCP4531988.1 U32 family peptidase [Delftia sp.]OLE04452.1 MAG: protease [Delftia sp. 13_1_20CM_4_67_18]